MSYFFKEILKPQDSLNLLSPQRPYNFSQKTRASQPLKTLLERTHDVLKKDISLEALSFRNTEETMAQYVTQIADALGTTSGGMTGSAGGVDPKKLLVQYIQTIDNYRNQRKLNGNLFIQLAGILKAQPGKKYICLIYQKNYRIIPNKDTINSLRSNSQFAFYAADAFFNESTKDFLDVKKVSDALNDADVVLHFIYLDKSQRRRDGMDTNELSGDIYNAFSKVSANTNGQTIATSKAEAALKKIFEGK